MRRDAARPRNPSHGRTVVSTTSKLSRQALHMIRQNLGTLCCAVLRGLRPPPLLAQLRQSRMGGPVLCGTAVRTQDTQHAGTHNAVLFAVWGVPLRCVPQPMTSADGDITVLCDVPAVGCTLHLKRLLQQPLAIGRASGGWPGVRMGVVLGAVGDWAEVGPDGGL
eukprot:jgi/Ulvmu1/8503/UM044_0037.1